MRFLLDNDMPDVVARVLVEAGHEVMLLRNVLPKKSVDSAVLDYARILECAKLLRLLESAGDSGLAGNINFA